MEPYRIPIMSVDGTLVELEHKPAFYQLEQFCEDNISGGETFRIEVVLGRMWYPEVVTTDRWLAWKLVQKY